MPKNEFPLKSVLANWNGKLMPLNEVKVSVLDRGFLFGDAVYEVIRVYQGQIWKADEHLGRLGAGLNALKIQGVDLANLRRSIDETLKASGLSEALIYIQITRGEAKRTHAFPDAAVPNELVYVEEFLDPFKQHRIDGVSVVTHGDIRWSRNDIKTTSLAANCLLAQAAVEQGCFEAILIDKQGYVTEGSHTSVFAVLGNEILMAPSTAQVLPGITKQQILELAQVKDISIRSHRLKQSELNDVNEVFLTATPEEILPVVKVDGKAIANGKPGPVTIKLQQAFIEKVNLWLSARSQSADGL